MYYKIKGVEKIKMSSAPLHYDAIHQWIKIFPEEAVTRKVEFFYRYQKKQNVKRRIKTK